MAAARDVIVIGGGIIGCAVARELARRGASVCVFEARTLGAGATQASAGVLAPYIEAHDRGPLFDLTVRSLDMYDAFVASVRDESGLPVEYRRCGTIEVAPDAAAAERLRNSINPHDSGGIEWLTVEAARELEPALGASIEGAVIVPGHGYVSAPQLTEALAWAALRHGVQIEAGRRVTSLGRDNDGLVVTTDDGLEWRAGQVVVAAGSWAGQLGINEPAARAVKPVRGQLLRLAWRGTPITRVLWGPDCYVVPWHDGTLLVGATVEDVGFDEHTTAAGIRDLLDAVCELLPEAWRATFLEARVGLRPATPDALPIIGASPSTDGLIYATGHYRNGILLAPLTASLVADIVSGQSRDSALDAVHPHRFK
jgi:glycine oxidase